MATTKRCGAAEMGVVEHACRSAALEDTLDRICEPSERGCRRRYCEEVAGLHHRPCIDEQRGGTR
jgi:hypothetical protein